MVMVTFVRTSMNAKTMPVINCAPICMVLLNALVTLDMKRCTIT